MDVPDTLFRIIECDKCPLYSLDDTFQLSGRTLSMPPETHACLILMGDIREAVQVCKNPDGSYDANCPLYRFNCNGPSTNCAGVVRLEYRLGSMNLPEADQKREDKIKALVRVLSRFPIFKGLDDRQLRGLGVFLNYRMTEKGEAILNKGDTNVSLYLMVSGAVEVIDENGLRIALLKSGEVFGEMSLITGEAAGATVRVVEPAKLLFIRSESFEKILQRYPSIQMYFARLLAKRLSQTNTARAQDLASGMVGQLAEMPATELFQVMNISQKTGALEFNLSRGAARVCFRKGELIRAQYNGKSGEDAFFSIIREREGRFKFTAKLLPEENEAPQVGEFMWLLMEGMRKIDEDVEAAR